jgi:hypothetical protein
MNTEIENEAPAVVEETDEHAALRAEIDSLVELTKKKVNRDDLTPCPACTILVHIKTNQCPHCESNIAANNALLRESLRRIDEIRAELDGRHGKLVEKRREETVKPDKRGRFRRFFSGSQAGEGADAVARPEDGPRILDNVAEGDQLRVLERDEPWYKVKTRDGRTGWVYSTLVEDR